MSREDILALSGTRMSIGLSSIIGVTIGQFQNGIMVKLITGGTLEIGGASLLWGQGWPFTASSETIGFNGSGTFYLCASGATCTVALLKGLSTPDY